MPTRRTYWLIFSVVIAVLVFVVVYGTRQANHTQAPVLSCPTHIDLGDQFFNDQLIAEFTVKNLGQKPLLLSSFSTSCTCAGVVGWKDGKWKQLDRVTISPGASEVLAARISVQGSAGTSQRIDVSFQTSDPTNPYHNLIFNIPRVKGNLFCTPGAVIFGSHPSDTMEKHLLRVFENGGGSRTVDSIRSTAPDRFTVRQVLPPSDSSSHEVGGGFVAEIEVIPTPGYFGSLNGMIEVNVSGERRESKAIPVSGEVLPEFVVAPSTIVLPRTMRGLTIWSGAVTVTARDNYSFRLALDNVPEGVSARVEPNGEATSFTVRIECQKRSSGTATQERVLRLTARRSGRPAVELEVPALIPR